MRVKTGIFGLLVALSLNLCPFSFAFADWTAPAYDAYGLLEEMTLAAGMSGGDLVATTAGCVAIAKGMSIGKDAGIWLGDTSADALNNLVEAADYPDWDTLTQEQKNLWHTKYNYDAAKFNSLMTAFGFEDTVNEWKNFDPSGGGNFEFDNDARDKLNQLGRIGNNWANGASNKVSEILASITGPSDLDKYLGTYDFVDCENASNWPAGVPRRILVTNASSWYYFNRGVNTYYVDCNSSVLMFSFQRTDNWLWVGCCSKNPFMYGNSNLENPEIKSNSVNGTFDGDPVSYLISQRSNCPNMSTYCSVKPSATLPSISLNNSKEFFHSILYGEIQAAAEFGDVISSYPGEQEIQEEPNLKVKFPEDGLIPIMNWDMFVADDSGSGSGSEVDLSEIITILKRISTDIGLLDRTSEDLTDLENAVDQFEFYANGILKVHDEGIYDSLTDIGNDIASILAVLRAWPKGDAVDAPDLIGDFNFPQLKTKAGQLVENISELAPFGGLLLLSEMVGILSQTGNIQTPDFHVPFNFMPGEEYEVVIDLSWLDDGRVYINFFCILSLVLCLLNVTIRIIELEAAS